MITKEKAYALRKLIEQAAASLSDEDALTGVELFPRWNENEISYAVGDRVFYNGILFKCLQTHTSQATWTPTDTPSLWTKVLIPDPEVIPEWEQPDSTNPYMKDDKVTHNGKTWQSDIDNNVWEPGVYGWSEVTS
jgi:chitodextrinase